MDKTKFTDEDRNNLAKHRRIRSLAQRLPEVFRLDDDFLRECYLESKAQTMALRKIAPHQFYKYEV